VDILKDLERILEAQQSRLKLFKTLVSIAKIVKGLGLAETVLDLATDFKSSQVTVDAVLVTLEIIVGEPKVVQDPGFALQVLGAPSRC